MYFCFVQIKQGILFEHFAILKAKSLAVSQV